MKKTKLLALLMSTTMALSIAPIHAQNMIVENVTIEKMYGPNDYKYAVEGGYIYFNEETGTITYADESITSANIPSTINGVLVTTIGVIAFRYCYSLTNVTIPNSVTTISDSAFEHCEKLANITIPSSVTTIGNRAFCACKSFTNITIPSTVTSIGDSLFYFCSNLTNVTIPSTVTAIGEHMFRNCESLTNITIPSTVTSIGNLAFMDCSNLESITIPSSVTSIGNAVFDNCYSLTSITIPNSVTSIGDSLFSYCKNLTSVTIPNSVTSIRETMFRNCENITSITIPNSITSIEYNAFLYCKNLTDVYYSGSESEWNSIDINTHNEELAKATIHYNSNAPQATVTVADKYSDINTSDWYYSAMEFAVNQGLLSGTSETMLSPNNTTSKAMIWTILYRYTGGQGTTTGANWYAEPQNWVVSNNLSNDINNPLDAMTREDLATMIYKIEGSPSVSGDYTSSFADSLSIGANAKTAMNWAVYAGLYQGNALNNLNPTNSLTRAEVATIFMRYMSN